jgi:hypothetical protein
MFEELVATWDLTKAVAEFMLNLLTECIRWSSKSPIPIVWNLTADGAELHLNNQLVGEVLICIEENKVSNTFGVSVGFFNRGCSIDDCEAFPNYFTGEGKRLQLNSVIGFLFQEPILTDLMVVTFHTAGFIDSNETCYFRQYLMSHNNLTTDGEHYDVIHNIFNLNQCVVAVPANAMAFFEKQRVDKVNGTAFIFFRKDLPSSAAANDLMTQLLTAVKSHVEVFKATEEKELNNARAVPHSLGFSIPLSLNLTNKFVSVRMELMTKLLADNAVDNIMARLHTNDQVIQEGKGGGEVDEVDAKCSDF